MTTKSLFVLCKRVERRLNGTVYTWQVILYIDLITCEVHLSRETCRVFDCLQKNIFQLIEKPKPSWQIQQHLWKWIGEMLSMLKTLKRIKPHCLSLKERKDLFNDSDLLIKFRILVCFVFKHFPWRNSGFGFFSSLKKKGKYKKKNKKQMNANLSLHNKSASCSKVIRKMKVVVWYLLCFKLFLGFFFLFSFLFLFLKQNKKETKQSMLIGLKLRIWLKRNEGKQPKYL